MRKPINASIPADMISKIDEIVAHSQGDYKNRSHYIEQAVRSYMGDESALRDLLFEAMNGMQKVTTKSTLYETTLLPRLTVNIPYKRAIGQQALNIIGEGQTLFLDGGTTNIELAKLIAQHKRGLTIVTNSALICLELGQNSENVVISVGGQFFPFSASFIGPTAEENVQKYFVDLAIFSTKAFIPAEGTFESAEGTLRIKQIVAKRCGRVILLIDHSKFGQRSMYKVLDVSEIHTVITDELAPPESIDALRQRGCEVYVVPIPKSNDRK